MEKTITAGPISATPKVAEIRPIPWWAASRRMLFIVSPFLVIVAVLVTLAVESINILAAGRAYVEGESLWSKNQKEAVFHLLLFAKSGQPEEFQRYRNAIKVPLGYRSARLELEKADPDSTIVRQGFMDGGTHPDDLPGVLQLYERFHRISYMARVLEIWKAGDEYIADLDATAQRLYSLRSTKDAAAPEVVAILNRIVKINNELQPLENRFSHTLGEATRWIQSVLFLVVVSVAGTLVPTGIFLTLQIVRRVGRAEEELKELRLGQEYAEKLSYHASHDALTGLANRPEFENRLNRALHRASRGEHQHAVMYLDLDQFKIVNDTCGHAIGDQLLRQVSSLLVKNLRETDTLARLGGDEFGVLLENCSIDQVLRIADKLRQCVVDFRFIGGEGRSFTIGASIGVVLVQDGMLNVAEILSAADAACYSAKEGGRNRVQVYRPHDSEISLRRGEMEWFTRLQRALDEDRFLLFSQEIFSIKGNVPECSHHELLVRMLDEDGALVPPMAFIPAAERYNLMPLIDQWVIKNALGAISAKGANQGSYAINVSGTSIGDERFLEFVREQFKRHKLPAHSICFELTETAAIANFDRAARFFGEMKSLGCQFSLDDFGAGMSSFGYLRHLPVDFIKIDGSFVKEVANNPIDNAMVRAINDVGHVMGKKTIGEFVDGEKVVAALREIGVDYAQGHWMSAPRLFPLQGTETETIAKLRANGLDGQPIMIQAA
jgi:diguanylate cyclase (GGDEF)-like protein